MDVKEYLDKVAYIDTMEIMGTHSQVYKSKFDDSYMTHVGMEDNIKYLADREITDELTHGVGFSPKDGKWYGWSHRAIYGFEIGSTCSKGDCHYRASNLEDELRAAEDFWHDECHIWTAAELQDDGKIQVSWQYDDTVPNDKLKGTINSGYEWNYDPENFGRGEWVAETMEDAKQMAIDFNQGVA